MIATSREGCRWLSAWTGAALALALTLLWPSAGSAQTAPPSAAGGAEAGSQAAPPASAAEEDEPPAVSKETKQEARRHFLRGLALLRQKAWAPALAEFKLSRALYPTRVATNNAAIALTELQRYDEALDMFETLLRDFKVAEQERGLAQREIAQLRELVGTIDVTGSEPGASIVIGSVDRGEYPPVKPLRVAAGNHVVRVFKEGFEPFETHVDVAGGQTVTVKAELKQLKESGRLRVTERTGKIVGVVVDSVVVGQTPWEGRLGVGSHMVMLRGAGKLGSQPAAAEVKSQQLTQLALLAEALEAQLRINPTPPGASVWIDSVEVGNGVWLGRLKTGPHQVEVKAEGFLSETREVTLQKGERPVLDISLEQDEEAPMWRLPSKWTADVSGALVVVPTFGGDVAGGCSDGCERSVGLGGMALVHGSYELGSGLGFGLELGYLMAAQDVTDRESSLMPIGMSTATGGTADDSLRLQGFMAGATIGYHLGDGYPVVFRLGAGVLYGELRDERSGTYQAQNGGSFDAYPVADFASATYLYLDPGVRAGVRFAEHFELTAGVQALMLIAIAAPTWDDSTELGAGADGIGTYPDEQTLGDFVLGVAPGVNLRYDY